MATAQGAKSEQGAGKMHRKRIPSWWDVRQPSHTAEDLWMGTGDFRLGRRDFDVMAALFERNFMTTKNMDAFADRGSASNRLNKLFAQGIVARISVPRMVGKEIHGREFAYSLTALGLECLIAGGHRDALERRNSWKPPYTTGSLRNNVIHDLTVGDLCTGIVGYCERFEVLAGWKSARYTVQKANPMVAGGQSFIIVPDAAITLETSDTVLIEYEESLRPESFGSRLADYRRYFHHKLWEPEYLKAPKVLISASEEADRQRYWANPFTKALSMASEVVALYPHVYLIKEQMWRQGEWLVQPLAPRREMISLREAILGKV